GKLDSFRPRLTLSGPIVKDRLFFLQSFEYRFTRARVTSLPEPHNDTTSENINSFTQMDLNINKANRLKFIAAFFPQRVNYLGLNTFNPQGVTPNLKETGSLFSLSEQMIFGDASFLTSGLSYRTFDVDVFAQGTEPMTVRPDENSGNYFADSSRQSRRIQWQETYFARPLNFEGQHSLKLGTEFNKTSVSGLFHRRSILIRRNDNTLAERIDFAGDGWVSRTTTEVAAFLQDRWVVNKRLTVDAGLRFDRDSIAKHDNFVPRLSFLLLPFKGDRTVLRGGIGIFYDRVPLSVGNFEFDTDEDDILFASSADALFRSKSFTHMPRRIVTMFAADGTTVLDGPRRFKNRVENLRQDPYSVRWNLQLDRELTRNLTARIGYMQRSTRNDLIIEPRMGRLNTGRLVLTPRGRSRYRELQLLATYFSRRVGNWTASYTWSKSEGDLNTIDNFLGDTPALVVQPNEYGPLPFDAPHRFLAYGQIKARDRAGRFPYYVSLDLQVTKDFKIPDFVPRFGGKRARAGAAVFNLTNHFNPRDVENNTGSAHLGEFYNSLGTSVRGKFEIDF
ncbi:MAG: TonB-dependent receptor, partial [Acidobacteriota bacterium]|nr:TonB-dependent receptor [Acidobacteriota bacterium]